MAAPLFDVRDALAGEIGERSAQDVLTALKGWLRDGTVVFAHLERTAGVPLLRGAAMLLIGDGEVKSRRMLGRFGGLASTHLTFQALQHPPSETSTLPSVDATAGWSVVRAAPRLVASRAWPALGTDLGGLHRRLEHAGWSGIERIGDGAALWHDGRLVAARVGKATSVEAVRALRRAAAEESAEITLDTFEGRTAAALHGLAETTRGEGMPAAGLVAEAERTIFVTRGEIDLAVAGGCGASGTFVASDRLASAPIRLPDEPAGWESYRYTLTLRGRDALNPMTDLWWRFEAQYGTRGRALLETVGKGDPLDQVARATGTDFDEVRKVVEKWEGDGVVRRG